MMYHILPYSYNQALKLGVKIGPSHRKNKKIDVYDWNGQYICSIGDSRYLDYPNFAKKFGIEYANNKRRLYRLRHGKEKQKPDWIGSPSFYSWFLLW